MTEDDSDFDHIDEVSVIDKIDILLTLIENGSENSRTRYRALAAVLSEAKFQLLHAWNEAQYYLELCEGYEKTIKQIGDELR
jgi:hypothetical protein